MSRKGPPTAEPPPPKDLDSAPPGDPATGSRLQIAVVGAGSCSSALAAVAEEIGRRLAQAGAVLVTGGRTGVMAAASRGARQAGGRVVGILPGASRAESPPNEWVEVALFTGMGQARNLVVVLSGAVVLAVGGGWGTLSEIALALKHRIPVVRVPDPDGPDSVPSRPDGSAEPLLHTAATADEAVRRALQLAR